MAAAILAAMDGGDALAGLDEIDWAGLSHAYGPAGDVPGLLRALAAGSPADREHALHALYGNIFHQGSRYEATAYAVPFLARLAADPRTPQRDEIVLLLAALRSAEDELAAYDAVRAEVPRLRGLLRDGDPRIRAAAAYLTGWFPQEAQDSASALRALLATEASPAVTATAVVSAGLLGGTDLIPQLRTGLTGPEPLSTAICPSRPRRDPGRPDCHRYCPRERVQQVPHGEPVRRHLRRARDDRRVRNTGSAPHRAYRLSPRSITFSRRAWRRPGHSSSRLPQRRPMHSHPTAHTWYWPVSLAVLRYWPLARRVRA